MLVAKNKKTNNYDFLDVIKNYINNSENNYKQNNNNINYRLSNYNFLLKNASIIMPNRKREDWKYTDFNKILQKEFIINNQNCEYNQDLLNKIKDKLYNKKPDNKILDIEYSNIVILDGKYNTELSNCDADLSINNIDNINLNNTDFNNINLNQEKNINNNYDYFGKYFINSSYNGGVKLDLKNKFNNIKITYINTGYSNNKFINIKNIINIAENCELNLIEEYININNPHDTSDNYTDNCSKFYLSINILTDINLEQKSRVYHCNLQNLDLNNNFSSSYNLSFYNIKQAQNSSYTNYNFNIGAKLAKQDIRVYHMGDNCHTDLHGIFVGNNKQHLDSHLKIYHYNSNSTSKQNYRGILSDNSHGVFNGMVYVAENTKNNTAVQSNKNLLLSKNAEVDTKPELQIYSEDVVCSHGATIGKLDKNALFYLQSRGINLSEAKKLLLEAFARDILDNIKDKYILNWLDNNLYFKIDNL